MFKELGNMIVSGIKYSRGLLSKERLSGGEMEKYRCIVCEWVYDPADNDNVPFVDLPEDWVCPECGVGKDQFAKVVD